MNLKENVYMTIQKKRLEKYERRLKRQTRNKNEFEQI